MSLISKWGKTRKMMSTLLSSHTKVRRTRVRDIKTTQEGKTKIERKGFILYIWSLQRFLFVLLWVRACHGWGPCCHSYSIPHRASSECVCVLNVRRIILKMSKATHAHCYSFWLWRKTDDGSKKREKQEGFPFISDWPLSLVSPSKTWPIHHTDLWTGWRNTSCCMYDRDRHSKQKLSFHIKW